MHLKNSKTIVIKIGSSLLMDDKKKIRNKWLFEFSKDIKNLLNQNKKIIIVSSGAIAMGCKKLNLSKKNLKLEKSQAVASVGQIELMKELEGWTYYDLPSRLIGIIWKGKYKGQKQKWFVLKFLGKDNEINIQTRNSGFLV